MHRNCEPGFLGVTGTSFGRATCLQRYIGPMSEDLKPEQIGAVTMLLRSGKTIKEIAKFAELDSYAITKVARKLDIEPQDEAQKRAKVLYASPAGSTFQEIAQTLASEGFTAEDGAAMHHLTVASWVKNYGWPWGGAEDGDYAPERAATGSTRSKYVLRLSKALDAEVNTPTKIAAAAEAAWSELSADKTTIVQLAIVRGAAQTGVTDLAAVKKALLDTHGVEIRTARA